MIDGSEVFEFLIFEGRIHFNACDLVQAELKSSYVYLSTRKKNTVDVSFYYAIGVEPSIRIPPFGTEERPSDLVL